LDLNDLKWVSEFSFASHGAQIGVRATHHLPLERLDQILPFGSVVEHTRNPDVLYSLLGAGSGGLMTLCQIYEGPRCISEEVSIGQALDAFESHIHFQIATHARTGLFVHAGVVGWKGRAIVIPGRSMSGKSSLVAALVRAGASYYSDEYAVIGPDGFIHPYPKRLSLRDEDGKANKVSVEELGGRVGMPCLPAGLILSARYRHGANWHPRKMTNAQKFLGLMDNTVLAQTESELAMERLPQVASGALGLSGVRGEACVVAASLLRRLDQIT